MNGSVNRTKAGKKALLIGGGAPNSTLIAGALAAFYDEGVEFDVISASGAGVLMGLLYAAPLGANPREALVQWAEGGINDMLYKMMPVNFKVFMKPGANAHSYRDALTAFPMSNSFFEHLPKGFSSAAWDDWKQLMLAAMSPSDLNSKSLGLCASLPFAEQAIDFSAVAKIKPQFYINAYNLNKGEMTIWDKRQITPAHVRASLSFPFIYTPTRIDGDDYIEGAALDTINFTPFAGPEESLAHPDLETLVVLDILGDKRLLRKPRNLYDAWVRSIITPLVKISNSDLRLFELEHNIDRATGKPRRRLLKVDLTGAIPESHWPEVLDWSQSNMTLLFDVGYQAGIAFCREHAEVLGVADDHVAPLSAAA
jgi:predicted acylesterase/phospholipase RssA